MQMKREDVLKLKLGKEFVLPDYKKIPVGYVRDWIENYDAFQATGGKEERKQTGKKEEKKEELQVLKLNNEQFTIPEVLFSPQDIGINEAGIPETLQQCSRKCDSVLEDVLFRNVIVSGGNANLPGFRQRIEKELQALKPHDSVVRTRQSQMPQEDVWRGLSALCG